MRGWTNDLKDECLGKQDIKVEDHQADTPFSLSKGTHLLNVILSVYYIDIIDTVALLMN